MKYICPVCGYSGLREVPYDKFGYGSDEICVCCGFQFGLDDFPDKEKALMEWRKKWIEKGYIWFSKQTKSPDKWNPMEQMKSIE